MAMLDNAGGGDCRVLALATGAIAAIQQEHAKNKHSQTFNNWQRAGLNGISLKQLLAVDLKQLQTNPRSYQQPLMQALQMNLRSMVVTAKHQDLLTRISIERQSSDLTTIVEGADI